MHLEGKVAAVFGFASQRSIAWGVAQALHRDGATVVFGIQSERFRPALQKATSQWSKVPSIMCCDVSDDLQMDATFDFVRATYGRLDTLCHCIAHATQAAMRGPLLECTRDDFLAAHSVSSYSLVALCRRAAPLMQISAAAGNSGGSVVAMSYLGSQRVVPAYRVMGPAKASLEAVARQLAVELVSKQPRGISLARSLRALQLTVISLHFKL